MDQSQANRYSFHGLAVDVQCAIPWMASPLDRMFSGFDEEEFPAGFSPVTGRIEPYGAETVSRHLPSSATPLANRPGLLEIYKDQERFWVVDDRWGLAELNMLKGQWRSWILPRPMIEPELCLEAAVLWPLAQLLRTRGLHLVPAVSLVRDNWGVLILSPCSVEPELRAMISAGFRVIGQRWTALREEDGRVAMLHMPGQIQRQWTGPRMANRPAGEWVDLEQEYCGIRRNHAFCQTVLMIEPGRRKQINLRETALGSSIVRLRRAWPIFELHPHRRMSRLAVKLARTCRCWDLQLSHEPNDLLDLLRALKGQAPLAPARPRVSVALSRHLSGTSLPLHPARREAV